MPRLAENSGQQIRDWIYDFYFVIRGKNCLLRIGLKAVHETRLFYFREVRQLCRTSWANLLACITPQRHKRQDRPMRFYSHLSRKVKQIKLMIRIFYELTFIYTLIMLSYTTLECVTISRFIWFYPQLIIVISPFLK